MTSPSAPVLPSTERALGLHVVRLTVATLALAVALLHPEGPPPGAPLMLVTGIVLLAAGGLELYRVLATAPRERVLRSFLVVDTVYVAAVLALSGGPESPLVFLATAHLVAVVVLLGSLTGLRIALLYGLLLLATYYTRDLGVDATPIVRSAPGRAAFAVVSFWLIGLAAAAVTRVNERDLQRQTSELAALSELATQVEELRGSEAALRALLRTLTEGMGFRSAAVARRGGVPALVRGADGSTRLGPSPDEAALDRQIAGGLRLRRRLGSAERPLEDLLPGATNVALLPLHVEGGPSALVLTEWGGARGVRIPRDTVDVARQCLSYVALALRNIRLQSELERLATTDALTGVANRRIFNETLVREVSRARRHGRPLSLVLLDVDHFKRVNDVHGHQRGDDVLRHVGRRLRQVGRRENLPARYGGEEFAVLLPDCDREHAHEVAERLRLAIADGAPLPITVSAGVAIFPECAEGSEELIGAADAALYDAKRTGRDRSVVACGNGELERSTA